MPSTTQEQQLSHSQAEFALALLMGAAERGDFVMPGGIGRHLAGQVRVEIVEADGKQALVVTGPPKIFSDAAAHLLQEARADPLRQVFIARALSAMAGVTAQMDTEALQQAVSAPSDLSALIRALQEAMPAADEQGKSNALERARLRGAEARSRLIDVEGGTISSREVAGHLAITPQAVNDRRKAGKLLALQAGRRGYRYPAWQFVPEGTLLGLEDVLTGLGAITPWTKVAFMLNANESLGGQSPLHALREGRGEAVVEAARRYGEQGA